MQKVSKPTWLINLLSIMLAVVIFPFYLVELCLVLPLFLIALFISLVLDWWSDRQRTKKVVLLMARTLGF